MTVAVAHRGEPVGHVENTLASFAAAVELGAGMIELDCQLSADGRVVVLHDATLARLWGLDRRASETRWPEIAALRNGADRIPLLGEVLASSPAQVMVDVGDPAVMAAAYAEVLARGALERCIFAGGLDALRWLRRRDRAARIALTWDRADQPGADLLAEIQPEWFNPRFDLATEPVITSMHKRGLGVSAWTVDEEATMRRLLDAGVDAVISNRVAALVALLAARGSGDRARA